MGRAPSASGVRAADRLDRQAGEDGERRGKEREGKIKLLRVRGIYEPALLEALTAPRRSLLHFPQSRLRQLIRAASRVKLRALAPLPGHGPFVLYRGVAGDEEWSRRERGVSWTGKPEIAAWFARRSPNLHDPAAYQVTVGKGYVLAYWNEREKDEYLVQLARSIPLIRLPWGPVKRKRMAARYEEDTFDHSAKRGPRGLTKAEIRSVGAPTSTLSPPFNSLGGLRFA